MYWFLISALDRIRPPFNTNRLAQSAAGAAYNDKDFVRQIKKEITKQKEIMYKELEKEDLFFIPSDTNFILMKIGSEKVRELCDFLLKRGIVVRPLAGYNLNDYIRVTIGKEQQNRKFLKALIEWRGK